MFFTMLVTTERLIHMRYWDMYSHHITQPRTVISILATSVTAILVGLVVAANTAHNLFAIFTDVGIVIDTVLFILLTVLFLTTYFNLQRKIRNINSVQNQTQAQPKSQLFLTGCVLFILLSLWVCWGPCCVMHNFRILVTHRELKYWDTILLWAFFSAEMNSALNPIIVLMINKNVRRYASICCHKLVETSEALSIRKNE